MSSATNVIAEGEVQQLMNCNDPNTTEDNYMQVIYSKTARLFEAATQISAIISKASPDIEHACQEYGRYLGTAFQLIDDVLDYIADGKEMGKNVGDDLAEGKPTLPLLHAMHHANKEESQMIRDVIEQGHGLDKLDDILACMRAYGSLDYTQQRAEEEADKAIAALAPLPDNEYKTALIALAHLSVNRKK